MVWRLNKMDKQSFWNTNFQEAQQKGFNSNDSKIIADLAMENYVEPEIVTGVRSIAVDSNYIESGNTFDILVGYVDSGLEENLPDSLDSSGFDNFESLKTKADIEHYNHDLSAGIANDLDEKWHHFSIDSELYKKGNEIRAKVFPTTELHKEFMDEYKKGTHGASIEYEGIKENNKITNWKISGFTFTKNPHYVATKPKNL